MQRAELPRLAGGTEATAGNGERGPEQALVQPMHMRLLSSTKRTFVSDQNWLTVSSPVWVVRNEWLVRRREMC